MDASYSTGKTWFIIAALCLGTALQTSTLLYAQDTASRSSISPSDPSLLFTSPGGAASPGVALWSGTNTRFSLAGALVCCSTGNGWSYELSGFAAHKSVPGYLPLLKQVPPSQIALQSKFFRGLYFTYENDEPKPIFSWTGLSFKEGFEEVISQHSPAYEVAKQARVYNGVALGGATIMLVGGIQMLTSALEDASKSDEELLTNGSGSLEGLGTTVVGAVITGVGSYLARRQIRRGVELFNTRSEGEDMPAEANAPPQTSGALAEVDQSEETPSQRKGFVIGGGIGVGLTSYVFELDRSQFNVVTDRQNKQALATDFKIGYAPSNDLALYWMSKVSWFSEEDILIANGFGGLGASYSLYSMTPGLFANGGIGLSTWTTPFEQDSGGRTGLGLVAGIEYEFSSHWIFDVDLLWGRPSANSVTSKVRGLKFTLNYFHY